MTATAGPPPRTPGTATTEAPPVDAPTVETGAVDAGATEATGATQDTTGAMNGTAGAMNGTAGATRDPAGPTPDATKVLSRAEGVELLGGVHGSGYKEGAALVRRGDGQMVHLGPLMYGLLECVDGLRNAGQLAGALSERLGRRVGEHHVARIA